MGMVSKWCFSLLLIVSSKAFALPTERPPFVRNENAVTFFVFIPSYNNEKWVESNLESLFSQTYTNWVAYYVNDCSSDMTRASVERYVKDRGFQDKVTIINNTVRKRAMANYVDAIAHAPRRSVVVSYDGDDRFEHPRVLENLAAIYADPAVWMTYGTYRPEPDTFHHVCAPLPKKVMKHRLFRKYKWVTSQLRTFYAELFLKVSVKDLKYYGKSKKYKEFYGQYVPTACDLAMMFPMLEMASLGHIFYVKEVNYVYNLHDANDRTANRKLQSKMAHYVRGLKRYKPLKRLFTGV
jgi:glycosyltransferase involved in cell wall biosynthesis